MEPIPINQSRIPRPAFLIKVNQQRGKTGDEKK